MGDGMRIEAKDNINLATVAAFLSNLIFGLSFMASRIALEHTSSSIMLALRFGASVLIMLLLAVTGIVKLDFKGKNMHSLLLLGLFQPIIYFIGEANGIRLTNSSFAGIMISLIPVVTAIGSGIFLHEKPSKGTYMWILCSVAGVAVISLSQTGEAVADKYVMLPVLYLSLASSVLAFALLNYSVTYLDAAKATVFTNLIPVISLLAGVLILGEPFSAVYLLGILLILAGVYKVNTPKDPAV